MSEASIDLVWDAIALHSTPGNRCGRSPKLPWSWRGSSSSLGQGQCQICEAERARSRSLAASHKQASFRWADGIKHKPETAFGNVNADVMAAMLPGYISPNFCEMIAASPFHE